MDTTDIDPRAREIEAIEQVVAIVEHAQNMAAPADEVESENRPIFGAGG